MNSKTPIIIAHRGASYLAPENTLASVKMAWNLNATHVEIDVKLTSDNEIVVFHDDTTKRYNNIDKNIKEYTFSELSKIDVGSFKGQIWSNEKIPNLAQILKTIPKYGILVVELKDGPETIPALEKLYENYSSIWSQIEFISFNYKTICATKKTFPNNKSLWLLDLDYNKETAKETLPTTDIIKKIKDHHLDGINVFAGEFANQTFFETIKKEGLLIYMWTINTIEHATKYMNFKPDAITTDRPNWLQQKLNQTNE